MHPGRTPAKILLSLGLVALLLVPAVAAKKPAKKSEPSRDASAGGTAGAKDAQWTLYCQAIAGPAHVEQAKAAKDQLAAATGEQGLKDWYVVHQEAESVIYHGFYRAMSPKDVTDAKDKREGERAQSDRKKIAALVDSAGNRIFEHIYFVQLAAPDPEAPPEWSLSNAKGFFTLQIAAYKDSTQRKQAAVDAVRDARAQGIEAYYYHGETTSSVCIGAWPRSAVREQEDAAAQTSENAQDQDILVLPQPLPENKKLDIRNAEGERVKTYAPRFEPIDPSLMAAMEKYPTHAVNGVVFISKVTDPVTKQVVEVEDPSYVVEIPQPKASLLRQQVATPNLLAPPGGATGAGAGGAQGGGKLRSLGDK